MVQTTTPKTAETSASSGVSEHKLTAAGRRLNEAMAALQDAKAAGVEGKTLKELEDEFLDSIQWYVLSLAKRFSPKNRSLSEEYLQAAYLGAVEALAVWDRERGAASTVVKNTVRRALHREVRRNEFPTMSDHDFALRWKISQAERDAEDSDQKISDRQMASELNLPESAVKRIREYTVPSSVDRRFGDDDGMSLADVLIGDADVVRFSHDSFTERDMLLTALRRVHEEEYDPVGAYAVIRALGLDGEAPESFPSIKRALGKTNTESLRLKVNKIQARMLEVIRSEPASFGLDPEVDLEGAEMPKAGLFEKRVDLALEAEARFVGGEGFDVESVEGQILIEVLRQCYSHELEALVAWHVDQVGDPLPERRFCSECGSPNSPRRVGVWGCQWCGETPHGQLFEVEGEATFASYETSKAWKKVAKRFSRTKGRSQTSPSEEDTGQLRLL